MVIGAETRTHSAPQISKIWDADPLAVLLVVVGGSGVRAVVAQGRSMRSILAPNFPSSRARPKCRRRPKISTIRSLRCRGFLSCFHPRLHERPNLPGAVFIGADKETEQISGEHCPGVVVTMEDDAGVLELPALEIEQDPQAVVKLVEGQGGPSPPPLVASMLRYSPVKDTAITQGLASQPKPREALRPSQRSTKGSMNPLEEVFLRVPPGQRLEPT